MIFNCFFCSRLLFAVPVHYATMNFICKAPFHSDKGKH